MFASDAHGRKVLDGPVGDQILSALGRVGLIGLCFYDGGARSFISTNTPIRTLSDLAGMRVRVRARGPWAAMLEAMGAKPRMISLMQAHTALLMGVVDADEADPATFMTGHLARVAKVYSRTEHARSISVVVFSKSVWNMLAVEDQRLIREAAMACVDHHRRMRANYESDAHDSFRTAGVSLVEDVDRSSFAKALRLLRARYVTDPSALEIAAKIRAADTELAKE